ncbi:MAG: hypothetical protein JWO60_2725 [Frankiales bacterium]|nr:hypothetical protein [Frankiales bacterium]
MPPVDDARTGVQRLLGWREQLGVPPAVGRVGARLEHAAAGTTTVRLPLTAELLLPDGRTSAAVPALLSDIGLTTSVVSTLPDARAVTTVSMTVDVLAPTPVSGALTAVCRAQPFADGAVQHAAGEVHDDDGRLVAVLAGWFLTVQVDRAGTLRRGVPQEPPAAHLHDLLGLEDDGRLHARDALSNVSGTLHGGVGALATCLAAERAVPGARLLTASLTYERPTARGADSTLTAEVLRQGRRTATVEAQLRGPDGRTALRTRAVAATGP